MPTHLFCGCSIGSNEMASTVYGVFLDGLLLEDKRHGMFSNAIFHIRPVVGQ